MIQDPVLLLAFMFFIVAFARYLEGKVKFVEKMSSAVVCTLLGIVLANIGVIPFASATHDAVFEFAVPYAIVLVILGSNLRELAGAGRPLTLAFLVASLGSMVGGFVSGLIFHTWVGPETWKLSGAFAGAFSGGGMNFAAVGRGLDISPGTFAAAAVADNLTTVPYLLIQIGLFGLLGQVYFRRAKGGWAASASGAVATDPEVGQMGSSPEGQSSKPGSSANKEDSPLKQWTGAKVSISDIALLGALPLAALWISRWLALLVPGFPEVLWLTTLALIASQFPVIRRIKGAAMGAYFSLHIFFIVLGASSILAEVVKAGFPIVLFMILIMLIHGLVVYGVGWLLKIDLATICVASQAAIGGPGSALALSMAMKWHKLVTPGILVGIFGYALGNYLGFACAYLVRALI